MSVGRIHIIQYCQGNGWKELKEGIVLKRMLLFTFPIKKG